MKISSQINSFIHKLKDSKVGSDPKDKVSHSLLNVRQNKSESNSQAKRNATLPPQVQSPAVQVLEQPNVRQLIARGKERESLAANRQAPGAGQRIAAAVVQFLDNMLQKLGLKQASVHPSSVKQAPTQPSAPPTKREILDTMKSVLELPPDTKGTQVLTTFIGFIPNLPTDRKLDKDRQMEGLSLVHKMITNVSEKTSPQFFNAIALATADIAGKVSTDKHSHSWRSEHAEIVRETLDRGREMAVAADLALSNTPFRMAKADKASSKAMEVLSTALSYIKPGQMDDALSDKLIVLLHKQPDSKHLKQLKADFLASASTEQRRDFNMHEVLPRGGA
jgi:hypothetical protein